MKKLTFEEKQEKVRELGQMVLNYDKKATKTQAKKVNQLEWDLKLKLRKLEEEGFDLKIEAADRALYILYKNHNKKK